MEATKAAARRQADTAALRRPSARLLRGRLGSTRSRGGALLGALTQARARLVIYGTWKRLQLGALYLFFCTLHNTAEF